MLDKENLVIAKFEELYELVYGTAVDWLDRTEDEKLGHIMKIMTVNKVCPKCGGELRKVSGQYGLFYGCSCYPDCDYRESIKAAGDKEAKRQVQLAVAETFDRMAHYARSGLS